MRAYFTQLRQELGGRLVEKVFGQEAKPSKVLTVFSFCLVLWSIAIVSGFRCLSVYIISFSVILVVAVFHQETIHGQEPVRSRSLRTPDGDFDFCIFRNSVEIHLCEGIYIM